MLYRVGRDFFLRHPHMLTGALGHLSALVPQGVRYGREFRCYRRFLGRSQHWSLERLQQYQLCKLQQTLRYAYACVPYYKQSFDACGVSPEDLRCLDDIRRFPRTDKEALRESYERFFSPQARRNLMRYCTGGTTGSGMVMLFEERFRQREQAFVWRMWKTAGYHPSMLAAVLQHRSCPADLNRGLWYRDRASNALILSAHRLRPDTIDSYLEVLDRYRPRVLIAYPSLAQLLVAHAREAGWNSKPFELVLCGSEVLYDFQRKELERFFGARVHCFYALVEACALFGFCRASNDYHVHLEYGHVELLREDGSEAGPGEVGEIVATGFDNRTFPLIRYHTRDFAEWGKNRCPCGSSYPVVAKLHGRDGDFIRTPSGELHSPIILEVLMDEMLLEGYSGFADMQIVQDRLDQVRIDVVPGGGLSEGELERFCRLLQERLGSGVRVSTRRVNEIARSERQKKRFIISRVSPRQGWPPSI